MNGVDVLDPTQNFTDEEWRKLAYIMVDGFRWLTLENG
jgi:hypothetical protein